MTLQEKELMTTIARSIVGVYDANGNLVDEYYNNIVLQNLTKKDFIALQKIADGGIL